MPGDKRDMQREITTSSRERDSNAAQFAAELERFLETNIKRILREIDSPDEPTRLRAIEAAARVGNLAAALDDAGYEDLFDDLDEAYQAEVGRTDRTLTELLDLPALTAADEQLIEAMIQFDFDTIDNTVNRYLGDLRTQIMRSVIGQQPIDLDRMIAGIAPSKIAHINTEITTGMSALHQAVITDKAIDTYGDNPTFVYVGPLDNVTRPFCNDVLSRQNAIYTLEQIRELNNDPRVSLDVMSFGGGYNCRHRWYPIDPDLVGLFE